MGAEPTCNLFTFALAGSSAAAAAAAAGGAGGEQPPALLQLVHTLSCQPHKLLTCHLEQPAAGAQEPPTPDTHLRHGAGAPGASGSGSSSSAGSRPRGSRLLLGLTDDVDCAVVAVSCSRGANDGDGGGGDEGGAGAGFVIEHVTSIPALAYVAAGGGSRLAHRQNTLSTLDSPPCLLLPDIIASVLTCLEKHPHHAT
jgi:KUP system potassium uptake protein